MSSDCDIDLISFGLDDSKSSQQLNIDGLPADIIRNIVRRTGLLKIDNLRLISPQWDAAVTEYLSNRERLPTIKWIDWHGNPLFVSRPAWFHEPRTFKFSFKAEEEEFFTYSDHEEEKAMSRISTLLTRCSRIEKLELSIEQFNNNELRSAINNLPIDELSILGWPYRDVYLQSAILNHLRNPNFCRVRRLKFPSTAVESSLYLIPNCASFFIQLVGLVAEVEIAATGSPMPNSWNVEKNDLNNTRQIAACMVTENNANETATYRLIMKKL